MNLIQSQSLPVHEPNPFPVSQYMNLTPSLSPST